MMPAAKLTGKQWVWWVPPAAAHLHASKSTDLVQMVSWGVLRLQVLAVRCL